jgi:hypothetical protein
MSTDRLIPVVLGVDVEPDLRLTDPARPEPWHGCERLFPFMTELRGRIARRHGRPPQLCWLFRLDPADRGNVWRSRLAAPPPFSTSTWAGASRSG